MKKRKLQGWEMETRNRRGMKGKNMRKRGMANNRTNDSATVWEDKKRS